jgi:hypothetical protein
MTKLLNSESDVPNEFYIFVNHYNPQPIHNLNFSKSFISAAWTNCSMDDGFLQKYISGTATYLPFSPTQQDCKVISPYCITAMNDYRVEFDAEVCRYSFYPLYPSRLSAIFAFSDFASCLKISKKWGWDIQTVKKFKLIEDHLTRVIKVNMEIVSLARYAYRISYLDAEGLNKLWRHYWSGGGRMEMELPTAEFTRKRYNSEEIFEYLIEGKVALTE